MTPQRLLAGDIGGTTTRLLLVERLGTEERELAMRHFSSRDHAGLAEIVKEFLNDAPRGQVNAACFAIAGPVQHVGGGEKVEVTNLPWVIHSADLLPITGTRHTRLINDFEAVGHAVARLDAGDLLTLQAGEPVLHGTRAVLGAGTGLGQAILVWHDQHFHVVPTEGGHVDFGPVDARQLRLADWLMQKFGRATYEQLLSGAGLVHLYNFLRELREHPESAAVTTSLRDSDPAAAVSKAAIHHQDPLACAALDLFVQIYGQQAGNLALTAGATGGVYIAGGIAPQIKEKLSDGTFLKAFLNKGHMTELMKRIPVHLILQPEVGLVGALDCAQVMLDSE